MGEQYNIDDNWFYKGEDSGYSSHLDRAIVRQTLCKWIVACNDVLYRIFYKEWLWLMKAIPWRLDWK